ncbi:MAG: DedA family protein [Planctomycetaceae bacterium]|nr:DedA family protein [Planctomycetaceae bacterium]
MSRVGASVGPGLLALCCALWWFAQTPAQAQTPHSQENAAPQSAAAPDAPVPPDTLADELTQGEVGRIMRRFSYAAIIVILLLCGLGLPLPEEIPILTSGVLAQMGHMRPWPALAALMVGVMLGDSAMFLLGKRWGGHLLEHKLARKLLTRERQDKITDYFAKYGALVIFIARFLPGLRAPLFLTAGSMRVRFLTFFSMDGLAALLSVPLSFWVAYYFTNRLKEVLELSHQVLYWVLGGVIVLLLLGHVVWDRWKAARKKQLAAMAIADSAAATPVPAAADSSEESV